MATPSDANAPHPARLGEPAAPGPPGAPDAIVLRLLATARQHFGMDMAWISAFVEDRQVFEWVDQSGPATFPYRPGDSTPLQDSYCWRVTRGELPAVMSDTAAHPTAAGLAITSTLGVGSYVGAPLLDDEGNIAGMVCCASRGRADHLADDADRVLQLVAELVRTIVSSTAVLDRRRTLTRERVARTLAGRRFHTVFQPIYSLRSNAVVGVEALTRFDEPPTRPDLWFADAHSVGLGTELELAAVDLALAHLSALPTGLYLSINASPELVEDPRLIDSIVRSDPTRLILELTEHHAIDDYGRLIGSLQQLRRLGVRIGVDDVGAGFASFTHVLELSPHLLKIDISIIRGIDKDPARQALATAIVEVARRLGADLVAEGVETDAELRAAADIGISSVQGYLLAKPSMLPLPEVRLGPLDMAAPAPEDDLAQLQFELSMLHSPIGVCEVALDGTFMRVNPALCSMLGFRPDVLIRTTFQEITHPEDLETDLTFLEQCLAGVRTSYRITKRYLRADGVYTRGDLTVVLVRSRAGEPRFFISQIVDLGPVPADPSDDSLLSDRHLPPGRT